MGVKQLGQTANIGSWCVETQNSFDFNVIAALCGLHCLTSTGLQIP